MKQELVRISDCNACCFRYARTSEYPSDYCSLSEMQLDQHTTGDMRRPIAPPSSCPLKKKDHVVKIHRRYTLKD